MFSAPEPALLHACSALARRGQPELRAHSATFTHPGLSERDRAIFARVCRRLEGAPVDFDQASRALREAVEELIPSGRVYLLGAIESGPVVGSLISGVGIAPGAASPLVVRVARDGRVTTLGRLFP
jgi:hypothetical protein